MVHCCSIPRNVPWDRWFGTLRRTVGKVEASDTRARIGLPKPALAIYTLVCVALYCAVYRSVGVGGAQAQVAAVALAAGNMLAAAAMHIVFKPAEDSWRKHFFFPFHQETWTLLFHWLVAGLIVVWPLYSFGLAMCMK